MPKQTTSPSNPHLPLIQSTLIQRCTIDRDKPGLHYDYMGSSEFEFGDQAASLRRMFVGSVMVRECLFKSPDATLDAWLIAREDFPFGSYSRILQGLAYNFWHTKEPTYLDIMVKRHMGIPDNQPLSPVRNVEAWFDFQNDVIFTLTKEHANLVVASLAYIKEAWRKKEEWLNSPPVKTFRERLEDIKGHLKRQGKDWFSLETVQSIDGTLRVWLNPYDQSAHNSGWFTLSDLGEWLCDHGPIMKYPK